jgi:hypothetical protein
VLQAGRSFLVSRARPVRGADNLTAICYLICGILIISQPCRPPRPATVIALLYFFQWLSVSIPSCKCLSIVKLTFLELQSLFCRTIVTFAALVSSVRVQTAIVAVDIDRPRMCSKRLYICRAMRSPVRQDKVPFLLTSDTEAFATLPLLY